MSDTERAEADTQHIIAPVAALLVEAGVVEAGEIAAGAVPTFCLEPLKGGRNNRTYRLRVDGGDYLLKWYFSHQRDRRDRLATEFAVGSFLWRNGIRQIAQPLAADQTAGLGLYTFLPGRRLTPRDVTRAHHALAIAFLQAINALRDAPDSRQLPAASEACFSLSEHVERIDERLRNLESVVPEDEVGRDMIDFVQQNLRPRFEQLRVNLEQWAGRARLAMRRELAAEQRILSPSDFGFHNVLAADDGTLAVVDLEYAGWDDPAKLIGDFFCQIEVPAVARGFDAFLEGVSAMSVQPEVAAQRARELFPFYQIKWCGIVLNDVLPTGQARRSFSDARVGDARRTSQLAIARQMFERVGCLPGPT